MLRRCANPQTSPISAKRHRSRASNLQPHHPALHLDFNRVPQTSTRKRLPSTQHPLNLTTNPHSSHLSSPNPMSDRGAFRGGRGGGRGGGEHHRGGRGGARGGGAAATTERPKKENILDLNKYMDKPITVKFSGGREGKIEWFSHARSAISSVGGVRGGDWDGSAVFRWC
ncbi:hypothetical protein BU16DRAFT_355523 [Lophium mytilinum]|uniref:Uncharacterized protein n=1 Tax=Lophium mytilinum TaxID=390894 RepID=A0A6A6QXX7_9PEZI|nr:hypothetical protein BU16DRAFT_355523 [Lophium mytilinum]